MTARVEREFTVSASPDAVWEFISDPGNRARAISVVDRFETSGETTTWFIELPIPMVRKTFRVRTRTVELTPPEYVRFEGNSSVFDVLGEHRIVPGEDETTIVNTFTVDGHAPGVEAFFKRNLDGEIRNLESALKSHLEE
ncbi:SRPBCC family protein [Halodesulfurarchaeum sp. HSR-GB]|uniref:CoxG family protein n=1 Tax=Halodesulfurarchaeum sp. HSR-GB TaxID=3074077 RepID=UPI00285C0FCA|nr:SRPBCC family protein [Halodesulfurarchaeum sp. HSR-GB]MDR5657107.1 SRPBCC family protein [Halodesulfurarchaeum sp. HSR-GB]